MNEKYKMIVVDDEEVIREGIAKGLDWDKWGFEVVGTAENGKEAIKLIRKYNPEVILTDIRMPVMDGIELINHLSEINNQAEVVIVSGYSDIEYYRKAIEYRVFDYILKPTSIEDFEKVFKKIKEKLDEKISKQQRFIEMQALLTESIPPMERNFLFNLTNGYYTD